MHRYTCKIILRTEHLRKDGKAQAYLQAFVNKKRVRIPLDIFVSPDLFDKERGCIIDSNRKTKQHRDDIHDENLVLSNALGKASRIFTHHRLTDQALTGDEFERKFKESINHLDFLAFMKKEISLLSPPIRSESTIKSYQNTLNKLQAFKSEIRFHELNYELISSFDRSLKTAGIKKKAQGINSVWKHHRNLKFFINQAQRKGIEFENPYRKFRAISVQGDRPYLTPEEIDILMALHEREELSAPLQRSLRLFLFACWSSLRISDVFSITHEMLLDGQLVFIPVKSSNRQKIVRVPMSDTARKFIERYSGKLFSRVSEKQVNQDLKEIARRAGIRKKITFHVARHTFAMMFLESGGPIEQLQKILGHSSIQTTMIYVHIRTSHLKESVMNMDSFADKRKKNQQKIRE